MVPAPSRSRCFQYPKSAVEYAAALGATVVVGAGAVVGVGFFVDGLATVGSGPPELGGVVAGAGPATAPTTSTEPLEYVHAANPTSATATSAARIRRRFIAPIVAFANGRGPLRESDGLFPA
jgi:hypothetical protein